MAKATCEQANLLLKLYDLRREPRMRQARAWFFVNFDAKTAEEMDKKYPSGSDENASVRMVVSYWEMAASFVNRGLIEEELFFENSGEGRIIWNRVKELVPSLRAARNNPRMWQNLEKLGRRFDAWATKANNKKKGK